MRLAEVVARLREEAPKDGRLSIQEVLDAFRARVYGPLLMLPAIIAVFPIIGALPGVSIGTALIMTLGSLQLFFGLRRPWLPRSLRRMSLPCERAIQVLNAVEPWARRFDYVLRPRLQFFFGWPGIHLTGALCVATGLLALAGAMVPGLIVPPALLMILIAFALIAEDGIMLLICAALAAATAWAGYTYAWPLILEAAGWLARLFNGVG